jgi:hypothetical protein
MNRLFADQSVDGAAPPVDPDPLSGHQMGIHAPDGGERDKAMIVDMLDHKTDLIAMTGQHDPKRTFTLPSEPGDDVAHNIGVDFIDNIFNRAAKDTLRRLLKSGRAGRLYQFLKKVEMFLIHG